MRPSVIASLPPLGQASERAPNSKWRSLPCATRMPSSSRPRHDGSGSVEPTDSSGCYCHEYGAAAAGAPCKLCNPPPSSRGRRRLFGWSGDGVPSSLVWVALPSQATCARSEDASGESVLGRAARSRRSVSSRGKLTRSQVDTIPCRRSSSVHLKNRNDYRATTVHDSPGVHVHVDRAPIKERSAPDHVER